MQVILSKPIWWLPILLAIAIALAYVMYFGFKASSKKSWIYPSWLLFGLRTTALFLLLFLLLSPLLKFNKEIKQRPVIHVLVDNSQSVGALDSFQRQFSQLKNELEQKLGAFDLRFQNLKGQTLNDSLKFSESSTDLTNAINKVNQSSLDQSKGVILMSDGIVNKGANPNYYPIPLNLPLYTIGLGDSSFKKDLWVDKVKTNEYVLLGNEYPIRISALSFAAKGEQMVYTIRSNGQIQKKGIVKIDKDQTFWQEQFMLKASSPGIQRIEITLTPLKNEVNKENNRFQVFVNVLDNRKKISILYAGAHPDIGAIRKLLSVQKNYEITLTKNPSEALKADAVVAVQWPNNKLGSSSPLLVESKKPILLIGGENQNWNYWQTALGNIRIQSSRPNLSKAAINESFTAFKIEDNQKQTLEEFPPLHCPFASYPSGLKVMAYQNINGVQTEYPLFALSSKKKRMAVLFGEGVWKWKINEYQLQKNNSVTEAIFDKTMQWLLSGKNKPLFSVSSNKPKYSNNESVSIKAELYNSIFEPLSQENVEATISGDSFSKKVTLNASGTYYESELGVLPEGNYLVKATAKGQVAQTGFTVTNYSEELRRTRANWSLLSNLSNRFNGKFYSLNNSSLLINKVNNDLDSTVLLKNQEEVKPLIDWPYLLGIVVLLLAIEWILRKYYGRL